MVQYRPSSHAIPSLTETMSQCPPSTGRWSTRSVRRRSRRACFAWCSPRPAGRSRRCSRSRASAQASGPFLADAVGAGAVAGARIAVVAGRPRVGTDHHAGVGVVVARRRCCTRPDPGSSAVAAAFALITGVVDGAIVPVVAARAVGQRDELTDAAERARVARARHVGRRAVSVGGAHTAARGRRAAVHLVGRVHQRTARRPPRGRESSSRVEKRPMEESFPRGGKEGKRRRATSTA